MDSNLTINTGEIRLTINNDPARVVAFNPTDVLFVEGLYKLVGDFEVKRVELETRGLDFDTSKKQLSDEEMRKQLELIRETCEYVRSKIDELFGAGTSQTVFGSAMNLEMFPQFFDGLTQFINPTRKEVVGKYLRPTASKVRAKKAHKK